MEGCLGDEKSLKLEGSAKAGRKAMLMDRSIRRTEELELYWKG